MDSECIKTVKFNSKEREAFDIFFDACNELIQYQNELMDDNPQKIILRFDINTTDFLNLRASMDDIIELYHLDE